MVSKFKAGEPAICVKQDKDKVFNVGDATYVNVVVDVPTSPTKMGEFLMVQKKDGGFIYLPSKLFRPLTDKEKASFEAMWDEATDKDETTD